jgi:hypothetical protein
MIQPRVRLIGPDGDDLGIVTGPEAIRMAQAVTTPSPEGGGFFNKRAYKRSH